MRRHAAKCRQTVEAAGGCPTSEGLLLGRIAHYGGGRLWIVGVLRGLAATVHGPLLLLLYLLPLLKDNL